jgi:hypothetical protein
MVRETQARLVELRRGQQETGQQLERMREGFRRSARETLPSSRF